MSVVAPTRQLTPRRACCRAARHVGVAYRTRRAGDGVVLCSGLGDTETETAVYRYALVDRSPAALAAVHAAAERRITDILRG